MPLDKLEDNHFEAIRYSLIKVASIAGAVIGVLASLHSLIQFDLRLALTWLGLSGFSLLALLILKRNANIAAILFISALVVPTFVLSLSRYGAGSGIYIAVSGLAATAFLIINSRASLFIVGAYTVVMLGILFMGKYVYPERFAEQYIQLMDTFHFNTAISTVLSLVFVGGAIFSIKRTYERSQESLVNEKDHVVQLHAEIEKSFQEKSDLFDISQKIQQMGGVFGFFYYPEKDELHQLRSDWHGQPVRSLKQVEIDFERETGKYPKVVTLLKQSLRDLKNWDEIIESRYKNGDHKYFHTKGELTVKGDTVEKVVIIVKDITETITLNKQLVEKANTDELTGINNRRRFEELLSECYQRALTSGPTAVYLFIDLDRFKIVNDTSGHQAGDQMLKEVCKIIKQSLEAGDVVGRLGGDEFALLLENVSVEHAVNVADDIREKIESIKLSVDGFTHRIAACIGVVAVDPSLGSVEEIQALADSACYYAKNNGRNKVEVVSDQHSYLEDYREKSWVNRIDEALENNHFALFYQDIARAVQGNISKREVLLRYYDKDTNRLLQPAECLAAAERYYRSSAIDKWVVSKLIQTLKDNVNQIGDCEYWINLSAQSLSDPRFGEYLHQILASAELPKGLINFEITETSAIRNMDMAVQLINKLKEYNCRFALDDFGTGYASYEYLRSLPFDCVKIDGAFVRNVVTDQVSKIFCKSIVEIAHSFGMEVTAEFVENEDIIKALETIGVDYLQGYAVSKPVSLDDYFCEQSTSAGVG